MYWVNVFSLLCTAIICLIAVFSPHFDDNFLQRLGLALICLTCFGRVTDLVDGTNAATSNDLVYVWKNLGIFIFALGTLVKFSIRNLVTERNIAWWKGHFPYNRRKEDHPHVPL